MREIHHPWCQHPLRAAAATENVPSCHGDWEWYRFRLKKIEKDGSIGVYMPWAGGQGRMNLGGVVCQHDFGGVIGGIIIPILAA
jgi:hypothetical protein